MVLGQGLRLAALGILFGVLAALSAGRVLTGLLYGVSDAIVQIEHEEQSIANEAQQIEQGQQIFNGNEFATARLRLQDAPI